MIFERIEEAARFWWQSLAYIALIVIPFSLLSFAVNGWLGAPLLFSDSGEPSAINMMSMLAVFTIRSFAQAALIFQLAALQSGTPKRLQECLLFACVAGPAIMLINIVMGVAVGMGLLLLILPGLWVFVRLSLAPFIVALERLAVVDALHQSVVRTQAIQWPFLAAWLILLLPTLIGVSIAGATLTGLLGQHGGVTLIIDILAAMLAALVQVLLFRFYGLTRPELPPS